MIAILEEGGEGVALGVMICPLVNGLVIGIACEILAARLGGDGGGEMRAAYEGRPLGWYCWKLSGFMEILPRDPS